MLFTSANYFIFLAIVFFVYCLLSRRRVPVLFLLLASYYFYALWNVRFLALVVLLSTTDFLLALGIGRSNSLSIRKLLVTVSVVVDVGVLFIFKYFNFFSASLTELMQKSGWQVHSYVLDNLALPLGLSFITFRSLSYVIDVYRRQLEPTTRYFDYLTFVAFFPAVIAGSIARARDVLPQFRERPAITSR